MEQNSENQLYGSENGNGAQRRRGGRDFIWRTAGFTYCILSGNGIRKTATYSGRRRPPLKERLKLMRIAVTVTVAVAIAASSSYGQLGDFTVTGTLNDKGTGEASTRTHQLYAYYMSGAKYEPDTIVVKDGKYSWQGKIELPEKINLMDADNNRHGVVLFIEPGASISIRHGKSFDDIKVKGSAADHSFRSIQKRIRSLSGPLEDIKKAIGRLDSKRDSVQMAELNSRMTAMESTIKERVYRGFLQKNPTSSLRLYVIRELGGGYVIDGEKIAELFYGLPLSVRQTKQGKQLEREIERSKVEKLQQQGSDQVADYIRQHPGSIVALEALMQYGGNYIDAQKVAPLFNLLPDSVRKSPQGRKYGKMIQGAIRSRTGQLAPDFKGRDTSGRIIQLSGLRGQYVLLDFWASWCVPCRAQSPVLVKAFENFKDKGFTILSVALERPGQNEIWMKAIHKDKLNWYHVTDFKYWDNQASALYGVMAVPQNFLIDPDGSIIAKNLFGEELLEKLGQVMP